jgi:hypothetical protein
MKAASNTTLFPLPLKFVKWQSRKTFVGLPTATSVANE